MTCQSICHSQETRNTINSFDWRHLDVLKFNTTIIKQFPWNASCFIVCEATCFGPYMTIIRPSYESSQEMLATCWDPNYVYNLNRYINRCWLHVSVLTWPSSGLLTNQVKRFLISVFRRDLNIVYFLLGISPASNCSWPTFRNPVSVPSSHCTPSLWRWNWYRVPKRRPTTIWRRGNTQKKIYNKSRDAGYMLGSQLCLQLK